MSRRRWVLAGCALAVVVIAPALVYYDQRSRPGHPVLTILGEPVGVTWESTTIAEFEQPEYLGGRHVAFGEGPGKWNMFLANKEHAIPGPSREEAKYFRQELLSFSIPDRLTGRTRAWILLIASGQVDADAKGYFLHFYDMRDVNADFRIDYKASPVDEQNGVISIQLMWKFPRGGGKMCDLRFRVTPQGLAFKG